MSRPIGFSLILLFFCGTAYATLSTPPPIKDVQLNQYLNELYNNHNVLRQSSVVPNGTFRGNLNEIIRYDYSSGPTLWINTDGNKAWKQIQ